MTRSPSAAELAAIASAYRVAFAVPPAPEPVAVSRWALAARPVSDTAMLPRRALGSRWADAGRHDG